MFRRSHLPPLACLLACLLGVLGACATTSPARSPTRGAAVSRADSQEDAQAPEPKPLGPLREFSDEEWKRIHGVQRFVRRAARDRGLSPSLLNGMIWVESKFERRAQGRRGPRGLLQLMPRTARALARRLHRKYRPYSADFNITAGAEYLVMMLDRFDRDLHLALAAYNAGPGTIIKWREAGSPPPRPRQPYVSHVERAARAFCERLPMPREEPDDGPFVCSGNDALPNASVPGSRQPAPS